jgi:hypothetical protein
MSNIIGGEHTTTMWDISELGAAKDAKVQQLEDIEALSECYDSLDPASSRRSVEV